MNAIATKPTNVQDRGTIIEITEEMEFTMGIGSDRYPYEVVEIRDHKTLIVRKLDETTIESKIEGYVDNGRKLFTPNPDRGVEFLRKVKRNGREIWGFARPEGPRSWNVSTGYSFYFGKAQSYLDPHF